MVVLDIHDIQSLNISNTHVFSLRIAQDEGIVWNQHCCPDVTTKWGKETYSFTQISEISLREITTH